MNKSKTDLTQERVRELFDYDYENGWLIRKKDNHGRVVNRPCGHKPSRSHGYGEVWIDGKAYKVHRIIWLWYYGECPEHEIDHIDQSRMNNRIENLRVVSSSENKQNLGLKRNNSTGFPGVYFNKQRNKFMAYIGVNNKHIYLGLFNTAEEAFLAYQLAKIEHHPTSPIAQQYLRELTLAG